MDKIKGYMFYFRGKDGKTTTKEASSRDEVITFLRELKCRDFYVERITDISDKYPGFDVSGVTDITHEIKIELEEK